MTPSELKESLNELGWSQAELARRIKVNTNTVTRWMQTGIIPGAAKAFVELKIKVKRLGK